MIIEKWNRKTKKYDLSIDKLINILEQEDGREIALAMLKEYKDNKNILGYSFTYPSPNCRGCKAIEQLKEQLKQKDEYIDMNPYYIKDEKQLGEILCKYMYDHLSPFDVIGYTFDGGVEIIRPQNYPEPTMRVTETGFECLDLEEDIWEA